MIVADIPGLIEGAAEGRGLGHQFLRHVERARVLCVLVDLAATDGASPAEQERILLHELGAYRPDLLDRPRLVVGSKLDVAQAPEDTWPERVMSAVTREGTRTVVGELLTLVAGARDAEPEPEPFVILRPEPENVAVEKVEDHEFRIKGREAERIVALSDLTDMDALNYVDFRLKKLGVDKALARAGAVSGDVIRIGKFSFDYRPD